MNIIEAIDDPVPFNGAFDDPSWRPWRVFLKTLFGLPLLSRGEMQLYRQCTGRTTQRLEPYREAALVIGRRGGKSRVLALIAVFLGSFIDWTPYLAPGEEATIAIIASDRVQARVIMRYIKGLLRNVPILEDLITDELVETIRLTNRVAIEIHTAKISSPRGRSFAFVACDEISFWRNDADNSANPDKEVIAGIRPGLMTLPGSMLLLASSPYGRRGVLWDTYTRHFGRDDSRILVWQAPTLLMNPALNPAEIQQEYDDDPVSAAAEYGAEFRSDADAFITRETIDAITAHGLRERLPESRNAYTAFCDPSGGSNDAMTLAIGHRDTNGKGVLDAIRAVSPPFSPESVVREFAETMQRYRIHECTGDRYGGEWPVERFREHQISYVASERNKSEIYVEFLPLANAGRVELLDHPRLATQLAGLVRRTGRGTGRDVVDHVRNAHDDIANAVCGVLVNVAGRRDAMTVWLKLGRG